MDIYTTKGYLIPAILVVLLLILAGFFVFSTPGKSNSIENIPRTPSAVPVSTSTSETSEEIKEETVVEEATTTPSGETSTTTESADTLE